jgi:CelD/BcsL family acetyltransferase involved in cellulose biosynthesis
VIADSPEDTVQVFSMRELPATDFARWAGLQEADPDIASPFFRPEFAAAVASVRDDVYVAAIQRGGETIGYFPFQNGAFSTGRPVGGPLSDCQGFIMRAGLKWDASRIVRDCGLSEWQFDHLLANQKPFEPFHRIPTQSPIIDLSRGYAHYVEERREAGSEQIKKAVALLRKLEREVGPVRFEVHSPDVRFLRKLMRWKSRQYRLSAKLDIFGIPWVVEVIEKIHAEHHENFAGLFSLLTVGDLPIAGHLGMRSRNVWHYWFPAYDSGYARYSPGIILLLKMAEHAEQLGISCIDMGNGRALYKQRLMNGAIPLAEGTVPGSVPRTLLSGAKNRAEAWLRHSAVFTPVRRANAMLATLSERVPLVQRVKSFIRFQ